MRTLERIGTVVSSGFIAPEQARLVVHAPDAAAEVRPGQFAMLDCTPLPASSDAAGGVLPKDAAQRAPFLRRPISFCDADRVAGTVTFVFRTSGTGTRALSRLRAGDRLSFLGPLGHGFALPETGTLVAVGGGIGVYPLLLLLRDARAKGLGTVAACGYRSPALAFLLDDFRDVSDATCFASDTGGLDFAGHAADAFADLLSRGLPGPVSVATCGPAPMMRAVAARCASSGIPCQASLEERMACGTGICLVCACKVKAAASGEAEYKRCCTEGPVFDAQEVAWE